jgi:hypothetical protein
VSDASAECRSTAKYAAVRSEAQMINAPVNIVLR